MINQTLIRDDLQNTAQQPVILPRISDFRQLNAPHVQPIRDVLEGKQYRYKVEYGDATFHFFHGCLMAYVVQDGIIHSLPPFGLNDDGTPYLQALPEHQQAWLEEFMSLPKTTLLFYFSMLKEVFKGYAIRYRKEDPQTGKREFTEMPDVLKSMMHELEWRAI